MTATVRPATSGLSALSVANTAALATLNADKPDEETITVRQSQYLNNLVEQDHRNIKRRVRPILGFKSFRRAQTILTGIELVQMLCKEQLQHPAGDGLSPAGRFYRLTA
ncbi:transposase (fragment) [Xenorhabdus bovienii str. Intermedium]|uniref:Transposase n=1 Tax=Xenorhabdus bovienii str. Intermedium TaxID=1379677 RepID=A0A077QIQ9_XENBV